MSRFHSVEILQEFVDAAAYVTTRNIDFLNRYRSEFIEKERVRAADWVADPVNRNRKRQYMQMYNKLPATKERNNERCRIFRTTPQYKAWKERRTMAKRFPLDKVYIAHQETVENEWSDFSISSGTEPAMPAAETVDQNEVITLREIELTLAMVEAERDSGEAIDVCTSSTRRTEFPAVDPISYVPEEQ